MNFRRCAIFLVAAFGIHAHAQIACTGEKSKIPLFKNVVIVVEENQSFEDVIRKDSKMPYLNELAAQGGLAHRYYANTHPSINNYFILTAGKRATSLPYALVDLFNGIVGGDNVASILTRHEKTGNPMLRTFRGRPILRRAETRRDLISKGTIPLRT